MISQTVEKTTYRPRSCLRLLEGHDVAGARDAHELGASDRRGDPFRLGRRGEGILLADHDQGGRGDAGKFMID